MKNPFKNKVFRRWFWGVVIVIVLLLLLRVPTRLSVAAFNQQTDLPIGLLAKKPDFSEYTNMGGFGMTRYVLDEADNTTLTYDVSNWPDMLFGRQQTTYIECCDPDYTVLGFSVGDDFAEAKELLLQHGFSQGVIEHQFERFGVIITCATQKETGKITGITIVAQKSINILPVVF